MSRFENIVEYPDIGDCCSQSGTRVDISKGFLKTVEKFKSQSSGKFELEGGKIILIGPAAAGKTSLFRRVIENKYDDDYKVTIGFDIMPIKCKVLGVDFSIQVWDTAGAERFKSLGTTYFRNATVALLCFDLHDGESFTDCNKWYREIAENCENAKLFLVGCKGDEFVVVPEEDQHKYARKINAEYWQTSAKTNRNVRRLFRRVLFLAFENIMKEKMERIKEDIVESFNVQSIQKTQENENGCINGCFKSSNSDL